MAIFCFSLLNNFLEEWSLNIYLLLFFRCLSHLSLSLKYNCTALLYLLLVFELIFKNLFRYAKYALRL